MTTTEPTYDFNGAVNAAFSGEFGGLRALVRRFATSYRIEEGDAWGILTVIICDLGYKDERLVLGQWYGRCQFYLFGAQGGCGEARKQALSLRRGWRRTHSKFAGAEGCTLDEAQGELERRAVATWSVSNAAAIEVHGRPVDLDTAVDIALSLAAQFDPDDKCVHAAAARLTHGDDARVAAEIGVGEPSVRAYVQRGKEKLRDAYHRTGAFAPVAVTG